MSNSTEELSRISRVVGKEGRIQARLSVAARDWRLVRTGQFGQYVAGLPGASYSRNGESDRAVAKGDLSQAWQWRLKAGSSRLTFLRTAKTVTRW